MRSLIPILAIALLASAAAFFSFNQDGPLGAVEPATVRFSPADQSVAVGAAASVQVNVAGVSDPEGLGGFEFVMTWNPDALTYVSSPEGPFLGSTARDVNCFRLFDANGDGMLDPGYLRLGCVTFGDEPPGPLGDGLLATVNFTTKCAGVAGLVFDTGRTTLVDPLIGDIPVVVENGQITITGAPPCPEPEPATITPTVTNTPGPPTATGTRTRTRTPTRTPTPSNDSAGDVDCSETTNAIDAALILQLDAGILRALRCPANGDVSDDGATNSIDALFILQYVAGLLPNL